MNNETLKESLESLGNALDRFGEALAHPEPDEIVMEGTIQRFEFTFELIAPISPGRRRRHGQSEEHFQARVPPRAARWEQLWLDMLEGRNRSSHVYNAEMARKIFARLPAHYRELRDRFEDLRRHATED